MLTGNEKYEKIGTVITILNGRLTNSSPVELYAWDSAHQQVITIRKDGTRNGIDVDHFLVMHKSMIETESDVDRAVRLAEHMTKLRTSQGKLKGYFVDRERLIVRIESQNPDKNDDSMTELSVRNFLALYGDNLS